LEDELKQFTNPSSDRTTFDVTKLIEYLLEKPLIQIAAYVCSAVCDEPNVDSRHLVSSDGQVKNEREDGCASDSAQKRAHGAGLGDEVLPKKLRKMESGMEICREIRSFRRGQTFINGR
jgi:hypothetical protein